MHDDFNELRNRLSRIESASYSTHTGDLLLPKRSLCLTFKI